MITTRFIIPDGFNSKFLFVCSKFMSMVLIASALIFVVSWFINKDFNLKNKFTLPEIKDLTFLILPMSPVIEYGLLNIEYLNINGFFYLGGTTLIFTILFSILFPILFSFLVPFKILMFSGLAFCFVILSMAKISFNYNPGENYLNTRVVLEGLYIFILFAVLFGFYLFNKNISYIAVILFTVVGVMLNFYEISINKPNNAEAKKSNRLINFLKNKNNKIIKKKNIYLLVYESYAGLETLKHYGYDNSKQMDFLKKNGFKIYHGIYSNSALSIGTTSRIIEINSKISRNGRYYTSGNGFGLDVFRANGYKTVGLFNSSYYFGSTPINWDEYYPKEDITKLGGKSLTKAIFEGEFRFDILYENINYENYLKAKKEYLSSKKENTFFFTHNLFPGHSWNKGKCKPNQNQLYFEGMKKANLEMKNDIFDILNNDKYPVIVLLGDHGPYLTKNCTVLKGYDKNKINKYDIQDRYGTFLSIYWPPDIIDIDSNLMVTQDILPAILANITANKKNFDELKVERKFFDKYKSIVGGVNVYNGIIKGGIDDGKPLFNERSYKLLD